MILLNFLEYGFIQRAYIAGGFIAVLCAMLGLFLVLRKLSLIGDGLSHVSFGAIALGLFFGIYPFYAAIPIVLLSSFLIVWLSKKAKIYGDAAIGIVSSVGIAVGVILASVSKGFNVDLFSYLFGNILAISYWEVIFSIVLSILVLLVILFFYNDLFSASFDETYAKATGIKTDLMNIILTSLTAITVVLAIKVVGIMLVSALLILPAVSALQVSKGFKSALFFSVLLAVISVLVGITVSFFLDIPAGAAIVMLNFFIFSLSFFGKMIFK